MEQVGVIYGSASTTTFEFAATTQVKRNSYVEVEHEHIPVLCTVGDVRRISDITFEDARRISKGERIKSIDKLSATAHVVGYRDEKAVLQVPRTPLQTGIPVWNASDALIRNTLGLSERGIYLGLLRWHDIQVCLDAELLTKKHVSILAKTGSGKSYLTGVVVEELLKHKMPCIIIDPHNEYYSLIHPNLNEQELKEMERFKIKPRSYAENIVVYSPDIKINRNALPLRFSGTNLDAREIIEYTSIKSSTHMGLLRKALLNLRAEKARYSIEDIKKELESEANPAKWSLITRLELLEATDLFKEPATSIRDLIKKGQATIINLRGITPEIQEIVVSILAKELFELRKLNQIPPAVIILEEAHNFCPQNAQAISTSILRTIASEGRKFGLGLCVVSQRPAIVDKNILSQCGIQIILKVTNPNDLKTIVASFEGLTTSAFEDIQRLPIGVAMIVGGNIPLPILLDIRVRETKHGIPEEELVTKKIEPHGEVYGEEAQVGAELGEEETLVKKGKRKKSFLAKILGEEEP
ncbi:MAG: ATP-binding protein [Candidatus Thermoplasmatota archaeon]|nr:ATP-binding protein [Candidatus Thermoplasmatota archaeon]